MSYLSYPKSNVEDKPEKREFEFKAPGIPKIPAEVKELTEELFLHPAEKPLFNAPVFRS
jgi:hypothetical protein